MNRRHFLALSSAGIGLGLLARFGLSPASDARMGVGEFNLSEAQWRTRLTPDQFHILREGGTERAFSSPLNANMSLGVYHCGGCDLALYSSKTKFHSGTGWPSFWKPLPNAVARHEDHSLFMSRTEIRCSRCAGHLGHVFHDGPPPTGLRYCMDGLALTFAAGEQA